MMNLECGKKWINEVSPFCVNAAWFITPEEKRSFDMQLEMQIIINCE